MTGKDKPQGRETGNKGSIGILREAQDDSPAANPTGKPSGFTARMAMLHYPRDTPESRGERRVVRGKK